MGEKNRMNWKHWSGPTAVILMRLGVMSPMAGNLGWRTLGCSGCKLFFGELREISRSVTLVLMGDFNFPGINQEYHTTVVISRSCKPLKSVGCNFLSKVSSDSTEVFYSFFNIPQLF